MIEELQKGYMFKDRLLRTAKVRVGKGENNEL
ncbi:MAG TPA: nucleotide exchange factor GrpE [Candidatus Nanoarchaeia archaeon]|nr:nucleotide exchange factor GrpE [Candidatus Nanoarchaeia archaeon]